MRWLKMRNPPAGRQQADRKAQPVAAADDLHKGVRAHALQQLKPALGKTYPGELFLAGGAFKPLINSKQGVRDLDIWVRSRREREQLAAHLLSCGAELVHDFHPFCMKFVSAGQELEITYQNVKQRPISEIVEGFDIACCAVAASYVAGKITDSYVSPRAIRSIEERELLLTEGCIRRFKQERSPDMLQSLHRIRTVAEELDLELSDDLAERIWQVYEETYTDAQREACIDTYLATTVEYKGRCDFEILRRATAADHGPELAS